MTSDTVLLQFLKQGALVLHRQARDLAHAPEKYALPLSARAQGRPATQDRFPTDPASSAALLLAREALHHWSVETLIVHRP